jgi:predicted MPP superfamily phosphohydrolase
VADSQKSVGTALAIAGAAAVGAAAYATFVEPRLFTLRHQQAAVLAPGSSPIRILHLSDLHMAPWQTAKQEWIRSLASLQPDLIINTGDNLGHVDGLVGVRNALEPFSGTPGVFVNGSNDYTGPRPRNPIKYFTGPSRVRRHGERLDTSAMEAFFGTLSWQNLNNAAGAIDVRGSRLEFVGVNDAHNRWDKLEMLPEALDELRESTPWLDDEYDSVVTVGVTHSPYQRVLDGFVALGSSVIFAGHTHGGQLRVPGYGALVTNCDLPRDMARGLHVWQSGFGASFLTVSAGRPEATLFTLTAPSV